MLSSRFCWQLANGFTEFLKFLRMPTPTPHTFLVIHSLWALKTTEKYSEKWNHHQSYPDTVLRNWRGSQLGVFYLRAGGGSRIKMCRWAHFWIFLLCDFLHWPSALKGHSHLMGRIWMRFLLVRVPLWPLQSPPLLLAPGVTDVLSLF